MLGWIVAGAFGLLSLFLFSVIHIVQVHRQRLILYVSWLLMNKSVWDDHSLRFWEYVSGTKSPNPAARLRNVQKIIEQIAAIVTTGGPEVREMIRAELWELRAKDQTTQNLGKREDVNDES